MVILPSLFTLRSGPKPDRLLAVPTQAPPDDLARLDSLCQVFEIGLVLFDANKPKDPAFTIKVRARRLEPDLFYTNRYMKLIEAELFEQ